MQRSTYSVVSQRIEYMFLSDIDVLVLAEVNLGEVLASFLKEEVKDPY